MRKATGSAASRAVSSGSAMKGRTFRATVLKSAQGRAVSRITPSRSVAVSTRPDTSPRSGTEAAAELQSVQSLLLMHARGCGSVASGLWYSTAACTS
eukprot:2554827-Rhodomonas_salina.1